MRILYVASEATPFCASGGLGDVMGSLPTAVADLCDGYEVGVILPLYHSVREKYREALNRRTAFSFYLSWRHVPCTVYEIEKDGVSYFFVDNPYYFQRDSMYGLFDDGERFAYFSRAVIEFILRDEFCPDILHANDWQSALSVVYLHLMKAEIPRFSCIKTIFTIHNIEYQGCYHKDILCDVFGIDTKDAPRLEFDGFINLLKAAAVTADAVTTVSPSYAEELRDPAVAFGLHPITQMLGPRLTGIINGIDSVYFDPEGDEISYPYGISNAIEGKAKNKCALQKRLSLPIDAGIPLAIMVTRLTESKGIDLVLRAFDALMDHKMQIVILGSGEKRYEWELSSLCQRYGERARCIIGFDRQLSKEMYAAADVFLMPSKTEPCGLAQMIACRYGAIPIVHAVGGLRDSIVPYGCEGGNGFVFYEYGADQLISSVREALALYRDPSKWEGLIKSAMETDFSWSASAEGYKLLYRKILS